MRISIELDERLVREGLALTGANTTQALVQRALRELVGRLRRKDLMDLAGRIRFRDDFDPRNVRDLPGGAGRHELSPDS